MGIAGGGASVVGGEGLRSKRRLFPVVVLPGIEGGFDSVEPWAAATAGKMAEKMIFMGQSANALQGMLYLFVAETMPVGTT